MGLASNILVRRRENHMFIINCNLEKNRKCGERTSFRHSLWLYWYRAKMKLSGPRKARFFTFNTVNDDIKVDLDFSIPFISIPVKQTMDTAFSSLGIPSVNVNVPALLLGGGVVLASTVVLPLLVKNFASQPPYERYAKVLEHSRFGADGVLELVGSALSEGGGVRGCALRVACWAGRRDHEHAARVFGRLMSNQLVSSFVNSTGLEEAIEAGRRSHDCSVYTPCPLRPDHYSLLMTNLAQLATNT